jgi:cytochrome b6-f complex iron-sulfur subunit
MDENKENNKYGRRQFFGIVWVVAGIALIGQAGKAFFDFMTPVLEEGAFGTVVYAGKVNEFEVGSVSYFREARFYLVRLEPGFLALYRKCPHLGCVVPWEAPEDVFNCPCHSSLFTRVGEVISGPAPRPMDLFPVEIRGDEVWVDTGQVIERAQFEPTQVTPVA